MKDAACLPDEFTTAMVWVGFGMGRFEGRSSAYFRERWTGTKPERGKASGREVQGACLSLPAGGGSDFWCGGRGLIASADRGIAEGIKWLIWMDVR